MEQSGNARKRRDERSHARKLCSIGGKEILPDKDVKEIDLVLEHDGILNPIEIKKSSNPDSELTKVFHLLDRSSMVRGKGAVLCMKPELTAIDRDNFVLPIWTI